MLLGVADDGRVGPLLVDEERGVAGTVFDLAEAVDSFIIVLKLSFSVAMSTAFKTASRSMRGST